MTGPSYVYSPDVFDCETVDAAKQIILTAGSLDETNRHWREDTPVLAAQIAERLRVDGSHHVLDFGCGIGRLAKPVMALTGCRMTGIDISQSMCEMASTYVGSARFSAVQPDVGFSTPAVYDAAYAALVIQHCENPKRELMRIHDSLRPGGRFVLVNSTQRWLPTDKGWANDRLDVLALACRIFRREAMFDPPRHYNPGTSELHYGAVLVRQ